jgi:hypothetical protein
VTDPLHRLFVHPGLLTGAAEVAHVRRAARQAGTPEHAAFVALQQLRDLAGRPMVEHEPRPHARWTAVPHHGQPGPARDLLDDAHATYANALLWLVTGDASHAASASRTIDAWATTLTAIVDDAGQADHWLNTRQDYQLFTSYAWPAVIWAAELLRAEAASGFDAAAQARFAAMLRNVVRPAAVHPANPFPNNWRSWRTLFQITCAVYLDDAHQFEVSLHEWRAHAFDYLGRNLHGELKRDLWHAQMGVVPLLAAAEVAWKHGVDLYGFAGRLLLRAAEYQVPFYLGDLRDWPFRAPPKPDAQGDAATIWNGFELAYNHYSRRLGLPTPQLDRLFSATNLKVAPTPPPGGRAYRPEQFNRVGYGTLTHSAGL